MYIYVSNQLLRRDSNKRLIAVMVYIYVYNFTLLFLACLFYPIQQCHYFNNKNISQKPSLKNTKKTEKK